MSFDPHARRFDPRWLFPAIETDWGELSEAPDASPFSWDEQSPEAPDVSPFSLDEDLPCFLIEREFDEALEQIASERCYVCPRCGATVRSDGSMLRSAPSGPISPQFSRRPNPIGLSWWDIGAGQTLQRWVRSGGRRLLDRKRQRHV